MYDITRLKKLANFFFNTFIYKLAEISYFYIRRNKIALKNI